MHDQAGKTVEYRDTWLEVFGFPVAYTPYLRHPDPTVRRQSGFLAPSFGNSSDLGFMVRTPYYWAIDEQSDATFTPILTTSGGIGSSASYRHRYQNGKVDMNGSLMTGDSTGDIRGHIDSKAHFDISPTWRWGLDVQRASDDTYSRRYGIPSESILTTRGYLEGFRGTNYAAFNSYIFQDLDSTSGESTPTVIPMFDFNHVGTRDRFGGYTSLDMNVLSLARPKGTDTRRIAIRPKWQRPFSGVIGDRFTASVSLATDIYHVSELTRGDGTTFSGVSGRATPQTELQWRLPLVRDGDNYSQTLEPIASVVFAQNGGNPINIPNEDSQELEFDDTNIFQGNRYGGFDRVDGGLRLNYGTKWGLFGRKGGSTSFFVGQSYRPRIDDSFSKSSGLADNFSDVVTRFHLNPEKYVNLAHRSQFSPDNFSPKRNELSGQVGTPALTVGGTYILIDQQTGSGFAGREQMSNNVSSKIDKYWHAQFSSLTDLQSSELRSLGLQVIYENECVKLTTQLSRSYFQDREIRPNTTIGFTLVLKTLGEIKSDVFNIQ